MTTSSATASVLPARIEYDDQYQAITISPPYPELAALFHARRFTASECEDHGYCLRRDSRGLLGIDSGVANAGLAPIVAYALLERGVTVQLGMPRVRPLAASTVQGQADNHHVARFLRENSHGTIRHRLSSADRAALCAEIAKTFPGARIAFAAASHEQARELYGCLASQGEPVTWADSVRCIRPGSRVIVATFAGLGQIEVIADPIDLLIFLEVSQAVGEYGQVAMLAHGRSRLFGFLDGAETISPYLRDLTMAAFGPCEVTVPSLGFSERRVETASLRVDGPVVDDHLTGYRLYRHGIERHPVRNRRVAHLARALGASDYQRAHRLCPALPVSGDAVSIGTAVLVNGIEHALELGRHLPGWSVIASEPIHTSGLSLKDRRQLAAIQREPKDPRRIIVTIPALSQIDLRNYGTVIWAAGGSGLPGVPREQLICPASDQHSLLWVDLRDGHHGELRRQATLRQQAYLAAGWFPVGQLPVVGRIRRFLAERPGGNP